MKGFTFATVAALAATSFAAKVTLLQMPCIQANATALESFDVELDKLTVVDIPSVCGLKITEVDGADIKDVKCRAYKDEEGKETGSAEFTSEKPAMIATNPVQEKAILCVGSGEAPTAAPTTFAVVSTSAALAAPTGGATPSGNSTGDKPSSPSPTPTGGNDEGAASTVGMSLGALSFAAVAMLFL